MMTPLNFLLLQAAAAGLPAPDPLQSYNWCVYRMAEARADRSTSNAVREALAACEADSLLDSAVAQVVGAASGKPEARSKVAALLRRQAQVNALARLNLIRSYARDPNAQN